MAEVDLILSILKFLYLRTSQTGLEHQAKVDLLEFQDPGFEYFVSPLSLQWVLN